MIVEFRSQITCPSYTGPFVALSTWMVGNVIGEKILQKSGMDPAGKGFGPSLRCWKEPSALTKAVEFRPRVATETSKDCALIG